MDNTLVLFDERKLFRQYFEDLYDHFSEFMSFEEFNTKMMSATGRMIDNDGSATNLEVFIREFSQNLRLSDTELWQRFDTYYSEQFDSLRKFAVPAPGATNVIRQLKNHGLKLVIATNPMFPEYIQKCRLNWANLDSALFEYITSVENSRYCKPSLRYYRSICSELELQPEECIMVGNDPVNDLAAGELGMMTYLITDSRDRSIDLSQSLINHLPDTACTPDYTAPLSELFMHIETRIQPV